MRRTINKKYLYIILSIVSVSILTLTLAYAALSVTLNISGSAQVNSAEWDIHFENPVVKSGSVTTDVPNIKSPTELDFSIELNMPGDFYEFTVEVVNDGSIDAMIEDISMSSSLTAEQLKFISVLFEYEDGTQITNKQILSASSFVKLKGRIEYRKDINASDLPTSSTIVDMDVSLIYTQADSTAISNGSSGSGENVKVNIVSGDLDTIGSEVCIGDECFYVISSDDEYVALFAKYNLYVGYVFTKVYADDTVEYEELSDATGIQNSIAKGFQVENGKYKFPMYGGYPFSDGTDSYEVSLIKGVVDNYKSYITNLGYNAVYALIPSVDLLESFGCDRSNYTCLDSEYDWIYSTSYWTLTPDETNDGDYDNMYVVSSFGNMLTVNADINYAWGVRPYLIFEKSELIK